MPTMRAMNLITQLPPLSRPRQSSTSTSPSSHWPPHFSPIALDDDRNRKFSCSSVTSAPGLSDTGSDDEYFSPVDEVQTPIGNSSGFDHEATRVWRQGSWTEANEELINAPYHYLTSSPTPFSSLLTSFLETCNLWFNMPTQHMETITTVVTMLHNASLLTSDLQTLTHIRNHYVTAHNIYGSPSTLNSANYITHLAIHRIITTLPSPNKAIKIFNEELLALHRGMGLSLAWKDTLSPPSEQEYLSMIGQKTGSLFRLGVRLMTLLSTQPSKHDLLPLADAVAMMSHIREDYLSLSSSSASSSSSSFPGMTLPILHALQTSKDERIATILGNSGLNEQAAKRARKVMRDVTGSEAYTFKMLESLRGKVCELVEGLEGKERRLKMNCIL